MFVRIAILLPIILLSACSSSDPYQKRAAQEYVRQERHVDAAINKAPVWMFVLPRSDSAIYENGTAVSSNMAMADIKAKTDAFGKICMMLGGKASQQTKIYYRDTSSTSTESSEAAIRTRCREIDLSGVEISEIKRVKEGNRFRTYVLVALPTGEANFIKKEQENYAAENLSEPREQEAFEALDRP